MILSPRPFEERSKIKAAYSDFYDQQQYQIAFTGTFKQVRKHPDGAGCPVPEFLTVEKASKSIDCFMNAASREIYSRSKVGFGYQLPCAGGIEGHPRASVTGEKRLHTHLSIGGIPEGKFDLTNSVDLKRVEYLLNDLWGMSPWGYNETKIKLIGEDMDDFDLPHSSQKKWRGYTQKDLSIYETERQIYRAPFKNKR